MFKKTTFLGILIGAEFFLSTVYGTTAIEIIESNLNSHDKISSQTIQFKQIKQPLSDQIIVTIGGLGLIGLDLWWFLFSKPPSKHK